MRRHANRAIALAATLLLGGALSGCAAAPAASAPPAFRVVDGRFVVTLAKGAERRSEQLIGATFDIDDGAGGTQQIRIDSVAAAKDRPSVLLHQVLLVSWARTSTWKASPGQKASFLDAGRTTTLET